MIDEVVTATSLQLHLNVIHEQLDNTERGAWLS
jgi:hypothetical protein